MYCCQLSRLPVPNLHRLQNQHRFTRNETLIWNFIGTFFKNIFNGCRDYVNMEKCPFEGGFPKLSAYSVYNINN